MDDEKFPDCEHMKSHSASVFYCSVCEDAEYRREQEAVRNAHKCAEEVASLREQVRVLTARAENAETHLAEANATKTDMLRDIVNTRANRDESNRQRRRLEEENDALRARVAELEASTAKHHDVALALCDAGAKACRERDAAQQRARALVTSVRQVTLDALETLEKMPTPTHEHKVLAELQRNLLQRLREETDAMMAATMTETKP